MAMPLGARAMGLGVRDRRAGTERRVWCYQARPRSLPLASDKPRPGVCRYRSWYGFAITLPSTDSDMRGLAVPGSGWSELVG
eukprot:1074608-Rhodomonas_salina.3